MSFIYRPYKKDKYIKSTLKEILEFYKHAPKEKQDLESFTKEISKEQ
jgi:hypothetical protein